MTEDRAARIARKLREGLDAVHVEVVDESHLHAGHAGARGGAGHYRVLVVSQRFEGLSPVAAQRLVYAALAKEMEAEIHALQIRALSPARWSSAG
jgi:BolA protein